MIIRPDNSPLEIQSPFGGIAKLIQKVTIDEICEKYRQKCGVDVSPSFRNLETDEVYLYQCQNTGYKFWRPSEIVGDEDFYKKISTSWPNYYRTTRWEHFYARKYLSTCKSVLEIGCGTGIFLKSLEGHVTKAQGIEFNRDAISNKVTNFPIENISIEDISKRSISFDAVYAFQVLEHITDPYSFIHSALGCVSRGGLLIFSVPNNDHIKFQKQQDAFDMPPHHCGHFNPEVCKKIAEIFHMKVENIHIQKSLFTMPETSLKTQQSNIYKITRLVTRIVMNTTYSITKEPGENILMVFKKQ